MSGGASYPRLYPFKFSLRSCQGVTREKGREGAGRRVSVGHGREMRGCNTVNPATRVVSGVLVGHFGEQGRNYSARSNSITCTAALATLVPGPKMAAAPAL